MAPARQLPFDATTANGSPWIDRPPFVRIHHQTLRQVVRTSAGGRSVRISVSNEFSTLPIEIGGAGVSLRRRDATITWGTPRVLTFGGSRAITIPPGSDVLSDPADLEIAPLSDLAIDLFLRGDTAPMTITMHPSALSTTYLSSPGDHVGEIVFPVRERSQSWLLLTRVDVRPAAAGAVIVAIGDSITDGIGSTPNSHARWTDELARRLQASAGTRHASVVNLGIGGNRLLTDGPPHSSVSLTTRYDREVLDLPGVRAVIVMAGINDIGLDRAGAEAIVAGYQRLVQSTRARAVRIVGATLTPYRGAGYYRPEGEATRQAVNRWIRTSGAFDAVIDFDAVLRDSREPSRLQTQYDSGDHLHPNDAGYKAMGAAIDLALLR
jgi:lysophospholipase L1-like esterase